MPSRLTMGVGGVASAGPPFPRDQWRAGTASSATAVAAVAAEAVAVVVVIAAAMAVAVAAEAAAVGIRGRAARRPMPRPRPPRHRRGRPSLPTLPTIPRRRGGMRRGRQRCCVRRRRHGRPRQPLAPPVRLGVVGALGVVVAGGEAAWSAAAGGGGGRAAPRATPTPPASTRCGSCKPRTRGPGQPLRRRGARHLPGGTPALWPLRRCRPHRRAAPRRHRQRWRRMEGGGGTRPMRMGASRGGLLTSQRGAGMGALGARQVWRATLAGRRHPITGLRNMDG